MKRRGRRRSRICANHRPLAVLHHFNHRDIALTRRALGDPGTLATLDINHDANAPMFNTDTTLSLMSLPTPTKKEIRGLREIGWLEREGMDVCPG